MLVNKENNTPDYDYMLFDDYMDITDEISKNSTQIENLEIIKTIKSIDTDIENFVSEEVTQAKQNTIQTSNLIVLHQKYLIDKERYKDEYFAFISKMLEPFIYRLVHNAISKTPITTSSIEDFMQSAKMAIWEKLDSYDPNLVLPLTYFFHYIKESIYKECRFNSHSISEHYAKKMNIIRKAAKELGYEDIQSCPIEKLAQYLPDMQLQTIVNTLEHLKSTESIQNEDLNLSSKEETPEESMLKKETHDTLVKALSSLSNYQCFLVTSHVNIEFESGDINNVSTSCNSIRSIQETLKETGLYNEFCNGKLPSLDQIERDLTYALNILRSLIQYNEPRKVIKLKDLGENNYEQADEEDIITAFIIA